ncbi:hypothetical protein CANARDRAFT_10393 [[Candida] arabinofermentans NRRL YB-2248]|uniref:Uncharacterized protein n=1 Tax=[Candida] arabinofermentans NRRL YB-2248 TaxID=983967 RepID=A0A1E4SSU5_9ASCO|nr:hypothetical protein CANARDRAFT_10393 [[Candida] arabinofermentans NRRL YB-2248]
MSLIECTIYWEDINSLSFDIDLSSTISELKRILFENNIKYNFFIINYLIKIDASSSKYDSKSLKDMLDHDPDFIRIDVSYSENHVEEDEEEEDEHYQYMIKLNDDKSIKLSNQDVIVVDNHDEYDPYLLLSNTGANKLKELVDLNKLVIYIDDEKNASSPTTTTTTTTTPKSIARLAFESVILEPFKYSYHVIFEGTLIRFAWLIGTLVAYVFLYFMLGFEPETFYTNSRLQKILTFVYILLALSNKFFLKQLKEIIELDAPNILINNLIIRLIDSTIRLNDFINDKLKSGIAKLVSYMINNQRYYLNREELVKYLTRDDRMSDSEANSIVTKYIESKTGGGVINKLIVSIQDIILLIITVVPDIQMIYEYEIIKWTNKRQDLEEWIISDDGVKS